MLSSGFIHASALEGAGHARHRPRVACGRSRATPSAASTCPRSRPALRELGGAPAIIVGNAGEVNAGEFDPLAALADLAEEHGAWLHVDGAFGLFARVSPRVDALAEGVERAHSVIADGHKWLNVPYDCGFAFVRDPALLAKVFSLAAAYLPEDEPEPTYGYLTPESSQRARSIAVWAALRAWGRAGYREMVERHLDLAQRLARRVDEAPDLERLADVPLNIVCFRYRPPGVPEEELDGLNARLGRGRARRRARLRGDDELRRQDGVSAPRSSTGARGRATSTSSWTSCASSAPAARPHKVAVDYGIELDENRAVTNSCAGLIGCGRIRCSPSWPPLVRRSARPVTPRGAAHAAAHARPAHADPASAAPSSRSLSRSSCSPAGTCAGGRSARFSGPAARSSGSC